MKLMIASDLHGSAFYAQKLLDAFRIEQPEKLLLLGDLLYHGPRNAFPMEYDCMATAGLLNGIKDQIIAVRGNCDCEVDQMVLEFPMLADYALLEWEGLTLYATHGHLWNEEHVPPMAEGTILLNGHFHVPTAHRHEGWHYINPGSTSIPKGDSVGSYLILEDGVFTWKAMNSTPYQHYVVRAGKVAEIFQEHMPWGLRGDPFLWDRLQQHFADVDLPYPPERFREDVLRIFQEVTGGRPEDQDAYYVEEFSKIHTGMSSGQVCCFFWRKAIEELTRRLAAKNAEIS